MSREAMQMALEALVEINKLSIGENAICLPAEIDGAMDALRERLAQPERELVCVCGAIWEGQELVSAPSQRQWQGLTDEEKIELWNKHENHWRFEDNLMAFTRAIEAKLREKNKW